MPLPPFRLLLGLLLWLGVALGAQAQIAISPQLLDLTLDQAATTNAFRLYNYTSEDKRVRVSLVPWDKDAANDVRDLPSGETTLDRWAIVSPLQFDLPAGKSQAVRVAIRPAVALPPGEHRLMLYFNEETPPKPATTQGATLNVRFRLGAAVYVHVGPVERRGELHSVKADGQGMTLDVTNTGNATSRFDGQYVVYPAGRFPGSGKVPRVERAGSGRLLPQRLGQPLEAERLNPRILNVRLWCKPLRLGNWRDLWLGLCTLLDHPLLQFVDIRIGTADQNQQRRQKPDTCAGDHHFFAPLAGAAALRCAATSSGSR